MKKKLIVLPTLLAAFILISASPLNGNSREKKNEDEEILHTSESNSLVSVEEKIQNLYEDFSITNGTMPSMVTFEYAMMGYYRLKKVGKIKNNTLTIIDFSLPSTEKRMWVLDMNANTVLFNTLVAHGEGTGFNMAEDFSNVPNSHKSSLGFYLTAETYHGKHGLSLRLDGLEKGFNSNARSRYIVVHGADYATTDFINHEGRLGRSWGCPAIPPKLTKKVIRTIKGKSCLFIYYPSEKYLENSRLLNS